MSRVWISHVTYIDDGTSVPLNYAHTAATEFMSHTWMRNVTRMDESCHGSTFWWLSNVASPRPRRMKSWITNSLFDRILGNWWNFRYICTRNSVFYTRNPDDRNSLIQSSSMSGRYAQSSTLESESYHTRERVMLHIRMSHVTHVVDWTITIYRAANDNYAPEKQRFKKRIPSNTKKWTIAPFVDDQSTISCILGRKRVIWLRFSIK